MKMIIVTGMSGAGKSTALNVLEDEGYYCVDNMPISLIPKFAELANAGEDGYSNIAIGVDIRSGHALAELDSVLDDMLNKHFNYTILFLESSDEVLVKRYKETRRTHPLAMDDHDRIDNVIKLERDELKFLKKRADVIIDTSQMLTRELKAELEGIFFDDKNFKNLFVTVLSFGFKYGIPADADLVFDVRFLPNPYYIEELKYWPECYRVYFRFLYKGIIIKHNKTEPTYTKTSLFLCEKRRFFMARTEKGVVATI